MDDLFRNRFAERVRALRGMRSQGEFAQLLGVTQPTISGWEKGTYTPNMKNFLDLAQIANELPESFLASLFGRSVAQASAVCIGNMKDKEIGGLLRQIGNRFLTAA